MEAFALSVQELFNTPFTEVCRQWIKISINIVLNLLIVWTLCPPIHPSRSCDTLLRQRRDILTSPMCWKIGLNGRTFGLVTSFKRTLSLILIYWRQNSMKGVLKRFSTYKTYSSSSRWFYWKVVYIPNIWYTFILLFISVMYGAL